MRIRAQNSSLNKHTLAPKRWWSRCDKRDAAAERAKWCKRENRAKEIENDRERERESERKKKKVKKSARSE